MKISAPGRAYRIQENQDKFSSEMGRHLLDSPSWMYPQSDDVHKSYGAKNNYTAKHFWDQYHDTKNNEKDFVTLKDQIGVTTENCKNPRPSTAVRRHVKKISEEFTITQTKFENSIRPNGIVIHIEPSSNNKDSNIYTGALNSVLSPKIQSRGHHSLRKSNPCSKCGPYDEQMAPLVSSPPMVSNNSKSNSLSCRHSPKKGTLESMDGSPNPSPRRNHNLGLKRCSLSTSPSFSAPGASSSSKPRGGTSGEPEVLYKPLRRRKSQSASAAGISGGVLKVPFEQVKKAKQFTESAVREGKVFAIHGGFPAIREALLKRGWVEKVLHSIPYVNPHPQNCVCTNVGWHVPLPSHQLPLNHHLHPSNSSDSTSSSISTTGSSSQPPPTATATSSSSLDDSSSETVIINDLPNDVDDSCQRSDGQLVEDEDPMKGIKDSLVIVDGMGDPKKGSSDVSSQDSKPSPIREENKIITSEPITIENISDAVDSYMSLGSNDDSCLTVEDKLKTLEQNANIDTDSEEFMKRMTRTINTAFLGPTEIREGLKSINRKNLSIFQYSVPPYEKKRKSAFTKPQSETKSSKTDDEGETDPREPQETFSNEEEAAIGEVENGGALQKEEEVVVEPYNPYPKLDIILTESDKPVVARVLRNIEPNFLWCWSRDSVSFKHLSREQLVNRFPNTPFTTKFGLCETLQQLHWFSEAASVDTFVPRGFCIGHEDERTAFIHDYRTTACLNMLRWIVESSDRNTLQYVAHPLGEVPYRRIRQALQHVERFIQSCCHDDLDAPPMSPLREGEWDALLTAHHRIIHQGRRIKAPQHHIDSLVQDCRSALERVEPYWPQLHMDGVRNVWIVKPGAQSRGRGIFLLNRLEEILALVQSPLIYQTKYVVQKYMERPLLIHNTKFDIRQWFMVTDWNPLTLWMYKESYLRFCSQQYDLTNNDEAIHLSNNAIQCKYNNGVRDEELPEENMWDCNQFKEYLSSRGHADVYNTIIFPGMKDALIATMLAAQVQMDSFKHGFEFFGADFMLTEDFRPWLIEINSSPCMAPTTSVTKRMCHEGLHDTIKVVVDYRNNKTADTGNFELIYQDKEKTVSNLPYVGVTLQVVGRQIWKGPLKQDKRKPKKVKSLPKVLKSLPLITLQLDECGENKPNKSCPILDCQKYSVIGPTLAAVVSPPTTFDKICASNKCFPIGRQEETIIEY